MCKISSQLLFVLLFISSPSYSSEPRYNGHIVKFKNLNSFLSNKNKIKNLNVEKIAQTSFGNFVKINPQNNLLDQAIRDLQNDPNVEYVEPNYIIHRNTKKSSLTLPKDTYVEKQWAVENTGGHSSKAGEDLNLLKAWEITKGSKSIKIAVIDSGVDYKHPDLINQIDINLTEKNGRPGVDDDHNGYVDDIYGYNFVAKSGDPMDDQGHGTHCAGVIGASHNGIGVVGVMAEVKIIPIKFLDTKGDGEDLDAILAIDYALKRGANILSNSWGSDQKSKAMEDAIIAANKAQALFVVAAGNDAIDNDTTPNYPANFTIPNIISVGAFTNSGRAASFSNFGEKTVHVFAPGEDIFSTINNNEYDWMSGTSMATPYVAGVAGLMLSQNPNLTPVEIKNKLIRTSTKTDYLNFYSLSNGRVDAYKALGK